MQVLYFSTLIELEFGGVDFQKEENQSSQGNSSEVAENHQQTQARAHP